MSDYINYIDFNAIKLGNLANEIGDYKCAIENYSKALSRLRNYQGDRMQPIMMASDLVTKINEVEKKKTIGKSILKFDTWKLTKSSFVKGNQCVKYLYLDKYKRNEKTQPDDETMEKFKQGHAFEDLVRKTDFPNGVNVKSTVGNFAYFNSYTNYLLAFNGRNVIYEATIIEDDILIMCDIMLSDENGLIDVYEIKHSSELNDAIENDIRIQYIVLKKRFHDKLNSMNIINRSEQSEAKWSIRNIKDDLEKTLFETEVKVKELKTILNNEEPKITMGEQCSKPYKCEFIEYCKNKC